MTAETQPDIGDLFREYRRSQERSLRNRIVEQHMHLPDFHVRRYSGRGVSPDDLRQVALLSMLRAVDRFDPELGIQFATFANRTIDGELKRYFRDRTWSVRPPRRAQELHLRLRRADEDLTHRLGRPPTVSELADHLDETVDHVLEALETSGAHRAASLDRPVQDGDEQQVLADRVLGGNEPGFTRVDQRMLVVELVDRLSERDRDIISMRFFEGMTQPQIAERLGVSQSYLSRLLRKILLELRSMVEEDLGPFE